MGRGYQCLREEEEEEAVEVIVSVDKEHLPGLVTVVNSVLHYSSLPVRLHIVVAGEEGEREDVEGWLRCHSLDGKVSEGYFMFLYGVDCLSIMSPNVRYSSVNKLHCLLYQLNAMFFPTNNPDIVLYASLSYSADHLHCLPCA